jgi:hypothetical protein
MLRMVGEQLTWQFSDYEGLARTAATSYCAHNAHAHIWWLLLAVTSLGYVGYYVTRVRKVLGRFLLRDR